MVEGESPRVVVVGARVVVVGARVVVVGARVVVVGARVVVVGARVVVVSWLGMRLVLGLSLRLGLAPVKALRECTMASCRCSLRGYVCRAPGP